MAGAARGMTPVTRNALKPSDYVRAIKEHLTQT